MTEAFILGTLCCMGMLILRLPYALPVSVIICFTSLIPIFGAWIGAATGAFLIVFVSPIKALTFLIFLLILQQVEGNLIYPRVVGKSVGLPGLWVLAAVTIGGGAFGVMGMLLGVPVVASRTGGIPSMVEDGVTGLLFHNEDVEDLADSIDRIWSDHALAKELSVHERIRASHIHDGNKNYERLLEIYREILQ